jgi:hypothetical protein
MTGEFYWKGAIWAGLADGIGAGFSRMESVGTLFCQQAKAAATKPSLCKECLRT